MKLSTYQANGFYPLETVPAEGLLSLPVASGVTIVKGDYIIPSSGYATNTATAAQVACFGIAAENADNSAGSDGDINVLVIPIDSKTKFSVPVAVPAAGKTKITRAEVGTCVDLEANDDVDLTDTTITASALGFWIEDYDDSAEAVDGNTYGYAIGHFRINA